MVAAGILYARSYSVHLPHDHDVYTGQYDTLGTDDSARSAQQRADSIAAYQSYMRSKRYNDSMDQWRKKRMDSIRIANEQKLDSIKTERQRLNDSATAARQRKNDSLQAYIQAKQIEQERFLDSINTVRQAIMDSMNAIKEYRSSRHFKDSVRDAQQAKIDSIKSVRQVQMDSLMAAKQAQMDSLVAMRQRRSDSLMVYMDSVKEARNQRIDSMKLAQQARIDSLEKLKEEREELLAQKEDEMRDKKKKMTEDKIKKERESYTNEKMLKKKWSLLRRLFQNTTTRYNYYFNARNKMKEAEDNMYRSRTDNLDSLIALLPFDPDIDSAKFRNDMDSLIRRISVGIQIHDPRVKWQDDLYLLLGKAFYYKGDYKNAAASFQFVVSTAINEEKKEQLKKKKKVDKSEALDIVSEEEDGWLKHKPVKNDAILWLARVYIQEEEFGKAQTLLDMVRSSKNLNDRIKGEMEECYARYYLAQGMYDQALPYLDSMTFRTDLEEQQRHRSGFLAGQLYQQSGQYDQAGRMYDQVLEMHPPVEIDFKSSLNQLIARSATEEDQAEQVLKALNRMTKEVKYRQYYDQVFYQLALLQAKNQKYDEAAESFKNSITNASSNAYQKGKSYYGLADLYFRQRNYLEAKNAYDSALAFLTPADEPEYGTAAKLAASLEKVSVPGNKVLLLDSMLHLASLSERAQKEWARDEVKRRMEQDRIAALTGSGSTGTAMNSSSGEWYFGNEVVAGKGEADFKSRWGNRPLKDNWRRSQGSFGSEDNDVADDSELTTPAWTEEELLALIPATPRAIDSMKDELKRAYFDLGRAFFEAEDFDNAAAAYDTLLARYPDFSPLEEVLYDQYIMALRSNNITEAERIKSRLQTQYPGAAVTSRLGTNADQNKDQLDVNDESGISQHLDETYQMLNLGMFDDVLLRCEEVQSLYPVHAPRYMNKYNLIKAIATAGKGNYTRADSLLTEIITINSNDSLTQWAKHVQAYLKDNMPMLQNVSEATSTSFLDPDLLSRDYTYQPETIHYLLVYTSKFDGRLMGVKSGLTDYNLLKKPGQVFEMILTDLGGGEAVFIIKEFENSSQAKTYLEEIKKEKDLVRAYTDPSEIRMAVISAENYTQLLIRKKTQEYLSFYNKHYQ